MPNNPPNLPTNLPTVGTYSRYLQSVPTVGTYSRYLQSVPTVGTYSRYLQSVPTVGTYSRYLQSVPTVGTYSRYLQSVPTVGTYSRYLQSEGVANYCYPFPCCAHTSRYCERQIAFWPPTFIGSMPVLTLAWSQSCRNPPPPWWRLRRRLRFQRRISMRSGTNSACWPSSSARDISNFSISLTPSRKESVGQKQSHSQPSRAGPNR